MQKTIQYLYISFVIASGLVPLMFAPSLYKWFGGPKTLAFLVLTQALALLWVFVATRTDELTRLKRNPLVLVFCLFLLAQIVSSLLGLDPLHSFFGDARRHSGVLLNIHLFLFFLALIFLCRRSVAWKKHLMHLFVAVACILSTHALLEALGWVPNLADTSRGTSFMGNPIFLASFLTIPFFFSLSLLKQRGKNLHSWYVIPVVLIFLGILATGTRGALVGVALGLLTWAGQVVVKKKVLSMGTMLTMLTVFVLVSGGILLSTQLAPESSLARLASVSDENIDSRLAYWSLGLRGGLDHLILGVGNENYSVVANGYYQAEQYAFDDTWPDKPHNILVELFVAGGVIGLLAYLSLIFLALKYSWGDERLFAPAVVAFLGQGLFIFDTISASITFMTLLALIAVESPSREGGGSRYLMPLQLSVGVFVVGSFLFLTIPHYRLLHAMGNSLDVEAISQELSDDALIHDYANLADLYYQHQATHAYDKTIFDQGVLYYQRQLEKHPLDAKSWYHLGQMYIDKAVSLSQSVDELGREAVERVNKLAPGRLDGRNQRIFIAQLDGDITQTLEQAIALHQSAPHDPETAWVLAQLYMQNDQVESAVDTGLLALENGVKFGESAAFTWLGEALVMLDRFDDLIFMYKQATVMFPDQLQFYFSLAATYAAVGDTVSAIEVAEQVKVLDPASAASAQAFIDSL